MITRSLAAALAMLSSATLAHAQRAPRCSSEPNDARILPYIVKALQATTPVSAARATPASTPAVLEDNDACTRLRKVVRTVPAASPEWIDLHRAIWTFFDLGDQYGVLLTPQFDQSGDVILHARSTLLLFTKDVQPRYLDLMYF